MLIGLFLLSAIILVASYLRPPTTLWHRAVTWLAVIGVLAAVVALGIEYMMMQKA